TGILASFCGLGAELVGERVEAGAEQVEHVRLGDHVPSGDAVQAGQAGADPPARRLALLGVVRRQRGMAAFGRVLDGDLPGQVRVPRPGRQLVDRQRHAPYAANGAARSQEMETDRTANAEGVWAWVAVHLGSVV